MNRSIEGSLAEISRGAQVPAATLIAKGQGIQTARRLYEYAKDCEQKLVPDQTMSSNTSLLIEGTAGLLNLMGVFFFISGVLMILLDWFGPVLVSYLIASAFFVYLAYGFYFTLFLRVAQRTCVPSS